MSLETLFYYALTQAEAAGAFTVLSLILSWSMLLLLPWGMGWNSCGTNRWRKATGSRFTVGLWDYKHHSITVECLSLNRVCYAVPPVVSRASEAFARTRLVFVRLYRRNACVMADRDWAS